MKTVKNKITGEEMSVKDYANKMLRDVFSASYDNKIDDFQLDWYLWSIEDFCKQNGLCFSGNRFHRYPIEIY